MDGQLYHLPFGDSSVSLNGTMQSGKSQQSYVPFLLRYDMTFTRCVSQQTEEQLFDLMSRASSGMTA